MKTDGSITLLPVSLQQIKDLKGAVDMVQKNREKFPHINDGELGTRQQFVDDTQRTLNDLKSGMESPSVRRKMEEDEAKLRRTTGGMSNNSRQATNSSNANAGFIANQRVVTQQNIDEQDIHLITNFCINRLKIWYLKKGLEKNIVNAVLEKKNCQQLGRGCEHVFLAIFIVN